MLSSSIAHISALSMRNAGNPAIKWSMSQGCPMDWRSRYQYEIKPWVVSLTTAVHFVPEHIDAEIWEALRNKKKPGILVHTRFTPVMDACKHLLLRVVSCRQAWTRAAEEGIFDDTCQEWGHHVLWLQVGPIGGGNKIFKQYFGGDASTLCGHWKRTNITLIEAIMARVVMNRKGWGVGAHR